MTEPRFTIVFNGDIGAFASNPFHAETPFGRPQVIDNGDACAERDALYDALENLLYAAERHIFSTECQKERDAARVALGILPASAVADSTRTE